MKIDPVFLAGPRHLIEMAELKRWLEAELLRAQQDNTVEDAGRASAYARVLLRIKAGK